MPALRMTAATPLHGARKGAEKFLEPLSILAFKAGFFSNLVTVALATFAGRDNRVNSGRFRSVQVC
jgi:hypothetical protein